MKPVQYLLIRYSIIILISIFNVSVFYALFRFPTVLSVYALLSPFVSASLENSTIVIGTYKLVFIDACIAGAAYYLLAMLTLTMPFPAIKKQIYFLVSAFALFFIINIARIIFLIMLLLNNYSLFQTFHQILWYGASTIFVIGIWFFLVFAFKIKTIPFYTDIQFLLSQMRKKKH